MNKLEEKKKILIVHFGWTFFFLLFEEKDFIFAVGHFYTEKLFQKNLTRPMN